MISDEPDEDADTLDDEGLLETYVDSGPPKQQSGSPNAADTREWPQPPGARGAGSDIDAATLAWFKANHADWQEELRTVLRTWASEQTRPLPDAQPPG
jgi:hypothetical protein